MISIYNNGYELRGLSSDIKPIEGVRNGTAFIEMDTSELYYFNDEGNIWQVWVEQGGGGGGSTVAGVASFNGRRNAVVPRPGDYNAQMIGTQKTGKSVQDYINDYEANATPDVQLNTTSERPVQNKVITERILELETKTVPSGGNSGAVLMKGSSANYDTHWESTNSFMMKSVYDRNNNGKADKADTADSVQGPIYKATLKGTHADTTLLTEEDKGIANGVVPLDSTRKILPEYLPDSIMNGLTNGGIFDATTRVVTLSDAAKSILGVTADTMTLEDSPTVPQGYPANAELYYITTNAGTFANMTFANGDWLISLGNQWNQLKNGSQVSSVNGKTGAVTLNTDEVPQGATNLYFTQAEKAKLRGIEENATYDQHVIQSATVIDKPDGTQVLRLANKDGSVTEFEGAGGDLSEYLKKDGDGSQVKTTFTMATARTALQGNETLTQAFSKISKALYDLQNVAYTSNYNDLVNKPRYTGDFENNGSGNANFPYIDKRANDLQNYWNKANSYSKSEIDDIIDGLESVSIKIVEQLPTRNIDTRAEYWIQNASGGYARWRYVNAEWVSLGDTDLDLSDYLTKTGNGSDVTSTLTIPAVRSALADGDKLKEALGKIAGWYADFSDVVFSGSYLDLVDKDLLALKEDLDDYLLKQYQISDAGKVLVVGADGVVTLADSTEGVVRKGTGASTVVGNDTSDAPINDATGARATAFGNHTIAGGADSMAIGKYNRVDSTNQYAFQIGGGSDGARKDIVDVMWTGESSFAGQIAMGTNTNPLTPTDANHVANKIYVDNKIDEEIAQAGLMKAMVVDSVPDVADAEDNILYLVADPTSEGHYNQYKKVLRSTNPDRYIMANLGGTALTVEGMQVTRLPEASQALSNKVYQYVGSNSGFKFGGMYACLPTQFYGWISAVDGKTYWTDTLDVKCGDQLDPPAPWGSPIYGKQVTTKPVFHVSSHVGPTEAYLDLPNRIRDDFGTWMSRETADDELGNYHWVLLLGKLSDFENDMKLSDFPNDTNFVSNEYTEERYQLKLTAGDSIEQVADDTTLSKVTLGDENEVQDVTAQLLYDYLWKKIYPVGSIYTTTDKSFNPATSFGGTWVHVGADRVLWGVATNVDGGSNLDEQLPDIRGHIDWKDGGQAKTEISNGSGAFSLTNKNLGAAYPTGTGSSNSARGFDFKASSSNSVYKLGATVRPNAYTVHFWRRTA